MPPENSDSSALLQFKAAVFNYRIDALEFSAMSGIIHGNRECKFLILPPYKWRVPLRCVFLLITISICLFSHVLRRQNLDVRQFDATLFELRGLVALCLIVWCFTFLLQTFMVRDLALSVLVITAVLGSGGSWWRPTIETVIVLFTVTLGTCSRLLLSEHPGQTSQGGRSASAIEYLGFLARSFLLGTVLVLTITTWGYHDSFTYLHHLRWTGVLDDPNTYGVLMSAGVVLGVGLLSAELKCKGKNCCTTPNPKLSNDGCSNSATNRRLHLFGFLGVTWLRAGLPSVFLIIAIVTMVGGLICSFCRGALLGMAVGLIYFVWFNRKLNWRYIIAGLAFVVALIVFLAGRIPDSSPWYVRRVDFRCPSVQNRVCAWRAGFEIMRDYPLGVGWNRVVELYDRKYFPPKRGATAIVTNDYLMLGTQLGIPALLCFLSYVALCYSMSPLLRDSIRGRPPDTPDFPRQNQIRATCLAAALSMLVAFWFDGGFFKLPTATIFWILLEIGSSRPSEVTV